MVSLGEGHELAVDRGGGDRAHRASGEVDEAEIAGAESVDDAVDAKLARFGACQKGQEPEGGKDGEKLVVHTHKISIKKWK